MIDEIMEDASDRMDKSLEALHTAFARIRTGRASVSLLDHVEVEYYGTPTPIKQVATVKVEEGRTLHITPWEKSLIPVIEKSILRSNLGVTPASTGEIIRLPLPTLTEENRRELIKRARHAAEAARVALRNIRREVIHDFRDMVKEKMISEDEEHQAEDRIQHITDRHVQKVDELLEQKEADLIEI